MRRWSVRDALPRWSVGAMEWMERKNDGYIVPTLQSPSIVPTLQSPSIVPTLQRGNYTQMLQRHNL